MIEANISVYGKNEVLRLSFNASFKHMLKYKV
jgi:hypothetical protein